MLKPKWVICIDWFSPGYKAGGPITSMRHLIEHLHKEIDFYVITSNKDYLESQPYSEKVGEWLKRPTYRIQYLDAALANKNYITQLITKLHPEGVYVNGLFSKCYTHLPVRIARDLNVKAIVGVRGMLAPSALAIKPIKKSVFLKLAKFFGLFKNVAFHATNELEKEYVAKFFSKNKCVVAENLPPLIIRERQTIDKEINCLKLIFLGRVADEKNTLFAIQSLHGLNKDAQVQLNIYGAIYNHDYWKKCEEEIAKLPAHIQVNYKGVVSPELISDKLQEHHFLYLPTRGENFGHAILESLCAGVPVLISDQTPWQDLEKDYAGFAHKLSAKNFASTLNNLAAQDAMDYQKMAKGALSYAQGYLKKSDAVEQSRQLFTLN